MVNSRLEMKKKSADFEFWKYYYVIDYIYSYILFFFFWTRKFHEFPTIFHRISFTFIIFPLLLKISIFLNYTQLYKHFCPLEPFTHIIRVCFCWLTRLDPLYVLYKNIHVFNCWLCIDCLTIKIIGIIIYEYNLYIFFFSYVRFMCNEQCKH